VDRSAALKGRSAKRASARRRKSLWPKSNPALALQHGE
jgi:hypothetical protein